MEKFVSIEKMSKKARRALYQQRRGSWGVINPCTRKPENPKAYRRKKVRLEEHFFDAGSFSFSAFPEVLYSLV